MNVDCAVVTRRTAALARPGCRARWRARLRQCLRQCVRQCVRQGVGQCALLCAGLLAAGLPQAATVSAPDEPPGQATALRDPALRGGLAGPGVLDKALTGSVATGGKNLDLLLEMQRSDTAEASQPVPARPGAAPTPAAIASAAIAPVAITPAAKTLTAATLPQAGAPPEQSALSQSNLLGSDASLGTQPAATRNTEWAGGGGLAGGGSTDAGTAGGRSGSMDDRGSRRPHDEADDGSFRFWPRHARDFIRDNREWLLGGIAGLLLLGAAARAYGSRRR